jgi:hypothetical protein
MAITSILLGLGMAASAILGPLWLNIIRQHVSDGMESQVIGGDLVSLAVAAPLAIAAGVFWWNNHRLAPLVALGPAIYASYIYFQYITAPDYLRYPGNNEDYFPLFFAILLAGLGIAVAAWRMVDERQLRMPERGVRLGVAWVLIVVGTLLALAWSRSIVEVMGGTPSTEYLEHPGAFWLVRTMDLALVIPATIATGIGLLRRSMLAVKAACAVTAGIALLAAAVGSMAVAMVVRDDPAADPAFAAILLPAAVILGALTWRLWQPNDDDAEQGVEDDRPALEAPGKQRMVPTTH